MARDRPDLGDYIDEFYREATKIVEHAEEAARHYRDGDLKAVQLVAGVSHYKISSTSTARQAVMDKLDEMGVKQEE
jgi:hypothetical protein